MESNLTDTVRRVADKVAGPAVVGAIVGGLTNLTLVAIAFGIGVSIVVEAFKVAKQLRDREQASPYRYLTLVEKSGLGYSIVR